MLYYGLVLGVLIAAAVWLVPVLRTSLRSKERTTEVVVEGAPTNSQADLRSIVVDAPELTSLAAFTSLEFKETYDSLSHPNMKPIVKPPAITGRQAVDARIQELAEKRGYQLRHVSSGVLNSVDGIELQELLIEDWQELKQAAVQDGIMIELVSGYRSITEQTELFVQRLSELELSDADIISGAAESALDGLLSLTAPPGYSRHHSGYTIDLRDPGTNIFDGSPAELWLSADNYRNAKRFGFMPSYPDNLANQGPNPEPWEYVWVSKAVTYD